MPLYLCFNLTNKQYQTKVYSKCNDTDYRRSLTNQNFTLNNY